MKRFIPAILNIFYLILWAIFDSIIPNAVFDGLLEPHVQT